MNDFLQSLRNGQAEKQRTPKTRKNFDNNYHYTSPSRFQSYGYQGARAPQMKRSSTPPQQAAGSQPSIDDNTITSMLAEAVEGLSRHIETLAKNQDYLVAVQERTADLMERQAVAIERIVNHLNLTPAQEAETTEQTKTFENHYETSKKEEQDYVETAKVESQPEPEAVKATRSVIRRRKIVTPKTEAPVTSDTKLLSRDAVMNIIETMRAEGATYDQVASRLIELGQPTFSGRGEWHAQTIHRLCSKK